MNVRVLAPGLLTTVQDLGRAGHQHEGVAVGGAMDELALRVANLLVGNAEGDAALEATLAGPCLEFDEDALVAITGAALPATVDGRPVPAWRPLRVPAGATLALGRATAGCRAYIAVAGGIDVPPVLGSRSTHLRAGIGGRDGRALRRGDALPVGPSSPLSRRIAAALPADGIARWGAGPSIRPVLDAEPTLRIIRDRHFDALTPASRRRLLECVLRVGAQSDRMGYRLEGAVLGLTAPVEPISEAVTFGTVQLPPGGAPIVLMADRQTTGGYPRLAHVATVDLPLLAQLPPGGRLRLREVSLEEAQRLYLARGRDLARLRLAIQLHHR
ncbi:MAG: biotin-dependent carboxyltransferase [Gemmatimonadetes bacterium]|nr:biotin-dependent carboxyltransferase [Gemmatimonadota bacterium]